MGNHRGKFKWGKYTKHNGNLRQYWEAPWRMHDRHRSGEHIKPFLDLRQEWGLLDYDFGGTIADSREELGEPWALERVYVRYVTDWIKVD